MSNCFHFPPMPLDIISGKQNTSKCVHSTLVISDKREAAAAPGSAGRAGLRAHTATRRPRAELQRGAPARSARRACKGWRELRKPSGRWSALHAPPRQKGSDCHFSAFFSPYPNMPMEAVRAEPKCPCGVQPRPSTSH